ncbi:hypothetical protein AVEN_184284-1 [Araneus ventricosus]|uniref:Retrovirus-related Pol polyprotein from transposon TNT 1-94 n=1 Tax=Araneus ventricosus TaxID=182803 RepID=A0A4Y2X065_ARAVE|nr:hypothetical protein AVEN_184284-1 [Araneus ventricosus]
MKQYFENKGIKHERIVYYSPRSNGTAGRANRTLLDKARTLLIDSELPLEFWAEAVSTAECMHNITPTKKPYEDAAVSQEKDKWKDAMDKEINSFEMHNVWQEVERPQNKKVIKSRWENHHNTTEIHWAAVKRILRYLRGTSDYCLRFNSTPGKLKACTDASWSTTADAKSCSGYFLKLGENVVDWRSSKQKLVALSTMESELIVACDLLELNENHLIETPTPVETDSQGLID